MPPNARVVNSILRAMDDPRLCELIQDYHDLRGQTLDVTDADDVRHHVTRFLSSLTAMLESQRARLAVQGNISAMDGLTDGLDCLASIQDMVTSGEAIDEVVTVLCLFCRKMEVNDAVKEALPLLTRLDDFLLLLGLGDGAVSVATLWQSAKHDNPALSDDLWDAVRSLLSCIRRNCPTAC